MRHGRGLLPLWPAWVCRPSVCQASQAPRLDTSNPQPKGTQVSNNPGCTSCQLPAFGLVSELCRGDRAHPQSLGLRDSHLLLRCGGHCPCTDLCGRVGGVFIPLPYRVRTCHFVHVVQHRSLPHAASYVHDSCTMVYACKAPVLASLGSIRSEG